MAILDDEQARQVISYHYQLETSRFIPLATSFVMVGSFLVYIGFSTFSGLNLFFCLLMSLVCWIPFILICCSFLKKKALIFDVTTLSCPRQDPLFMFSSVTVPYASISNIQEITHAGKPYLQINYLHQSTVQMLFISQGVFDNNVVFEEVRYLLFSKLEIALNSTNRKEP